MTKKIILNISLAVLTMFTPPALAQELFREASGSPGLADQERFDDPATARSRRAAMNDHIGLRDLGPGRRRPVVLNLFEDVELRATLERVPSSAPGSVFLAGRLDGGGRMTLFITREGILRGEVHAPEGVYTVRSVRGRSGDRRDVIVREIDRSRLLPIHHGTTAFPPPGFRRPQTNAGHSESAWSFPPAMLRGFPEPMANSGREEPASADETVDVVAAYTPHAEDEAGGREEAEATILAEVEKTNLALANSGLEHRKIRLVAMERAVYPPVAETEYNNLNTLSKDKNQTVFDEANDPDGLFDEVLDMRKRHGGDLVHLFTGSTPGACGVASTYDLIAQRWIENYCADSPDVDRCMERSQRLSWGGDFVWAISGIIEGCTVQSAFTHELGHNFGLFHDRYTEIEDGPPLSLDDPPEFPITPYGFGYVNQNFDRSACFRTIMAYNGQCIDNGGNIKIIQEFMFSNPDIDLGSEEVGFDPAGVEGEEWTIDLDGPVNAARHIDEVWDVVAGLYDSKTVLNTSVWTRESFDLLEHFEGLEEQDCHVFTAQSSNPEVAFSRVREQDGNVHLETVGLAPGMTTLTVSVEGPDCERSVERFSLVVEGPVLVPLFPAADGDAYEGFVRIINHSVVPRAVTIKAYDDDNGEHGPVVMEVGANLAAHFNSTDLEQGNPGKGLTGSTGSGRGAWRLEIVSDNPRLEVLPYVRTRDGFVTSMYDRAPMEEIDEFLIPMFNPASNVEQVSSLRLINPHEDAVEVSITGIDDDGAASANPVVLTLPGGAARRLTSVELESGASPDIGSGGLGDGAGKWRLTVKSDRPIVAMSLLESPTGHLSNLSGRAEAMDDYFDPDGGQAAATFLAPFFPAHGDAKGRQGFVRVTNRSDEAVDVSIVATDSAGAEYGELSLRVGSGQSGHFNSEDLELGNPQKGLTGSTGPGEGEWRLVLSSQQPAVDVMSYVRTPGGFLTSMHAVLPFQTVLNGTRYRSAFFNPASNSDQASVLYVVNPNEHGWGLGVYGVDDANHANDNTNGWSARASIRLGAGEARKATFGSAPYLQGIGNGVGKWQLLMESYNTAYSDGRRTRPGEVVPLIVMSLLENPTGHLTNLSTQDLCNRGMTVWGCPGGSGQ